MRTSTLAFALVCGITVVASACRAGSEGSVGADVPLVETAARGLPPDADAIPMRDTRTGLLQAYRLTGADWERVRSLAKAHRANEPRPFTDALGSSSAALEWLAIDVLPFGRVASEAGTYRAASRRDQEFLRGLLPDVVRVAQGSRNSQHPFYSLASEHATRLLGNYGGITESSEVWTAVCGQLLDFLDLDSGRVGAWMALQDCLASRTGLTVSEGLRQRIAKTVRRFLDSASEETPSDTAVVGIIIRVRLKEVAEKFGARYGRAKSRPDYWIEGLCAVGDPSAPELLRSALKRPIDAGILFRASVLLHDGSLIPALEERLRKREGDAPGDGVRAIASLPGRGADEALRRLVYLWLRDPYRHALVIAVEEAVRRDIQVAEEVTSRLPQASKDEEVQATCGLVRAGQAAFIQQVLGYATSEELSLENRSLAVTALGASLRVRRDKSVLEGLLALWPERGASSGPMIVRAQPLWSEVLDALTESAWNDESVERALLRWLSQAEGDASVQRAILIALGNLGGKPAEERLRTLAEGPGAGVAGGRLWCAAHEALGLMEKGRPR